MYVGYDEPAMPPGREQASYAPWVVDARRAAPADPDDTAEADS